MYDLATAAYDGHWPEPVPRRSIVVCTMVRSGSTLLGEALHAAGGLGCPLEYLHGGFRPRFAERWSTPDLPSYLRTLYRRRVDQETGVFSIKVFWDDLISVADELGVLALADLDFSESPAGNDQLRGLGDVMHRLFPEPTFVRLQRADAVRRAVSGYRAQRTGRFRQLPDHEPATGPGRAPDHCGTDRVDDEYDYTAVLHLVEAHQAIDNLWTRFSAVNHLDPIPVRYEDLVADYDSTVRGVLHALGHPRADEPIPPPRLQRQADERSEAMCRRFLADHHA